jgi:hypothetical protein
MARAVKRLTFSNVDQGLRGLPDVSTAPTPVPARNRCWRLRARRSREALHQHCHAAGGASRFTIDASRGLACFEVEDPIQLPLELIQPFEYLGIQSPAFLLIVKPFQLQLDIPQSLIQAEIGYPRRGGIGDVR